MLRGCAERRRAIDGTPDDPNELFIAAEQPPVEMLIHDPGFDRPRRELRQPPPAYDVAVPPEHFLEPEPKRLVQPDEQFRSGPGEFSWEMLDDEAGMKAIEEAVESVRAAQSTEGNRRRRLSGGKSRKLLDDPRTKSAEGQGDASA